MDEVLKLSEILRQPSGHKTELARDIALRTHGWPPDKLEVFFAHALGTGLLKRDEGEEWLRVLAWLGTAQGLEQWPEWAQIEASTAALKQRQTQLQTDYEQMAQLQTTVRQLEKEQVTERQTKQIMSAEIASLEDELQQLERLAACAEDNL